MNKLDTYNISSPRHFLTIEGTILKILNNPTWARLYMLLVGEFERSIEGLKTFYSSKTWDNVPKALEILSLFDNEHELCEYLSLNTEHYKVI